jgi:hypothetical protein
MEEGTTNPNGESPSLTDLVTTKTVLVYFDGQLDLSLLFWSLPVVHISPDFCKGKAKIPKGPPGAIISAQYDGNFRGLKKSSTQRAFEHTISVDLSLDKKNVCVKVYSSKLHLSGVYSDESINFVCGQLLAYFQLIEEDVKYLTSVSPKAVEDLLTWIEGLFKEGRPFRQYDNFYFPPEVPEPLDKRAGNIMLRNYFDFPEFSDSYLSWLNTLTSSGFSIGEKIPSNITYIDKLMSNYKLDVKRSISRVRLAKSLSKTDIPGILVRYDNTFNHAVKLLITDDSLFFHHYPGYQTSIITQQKQVGGKPLHTFQIQASGKITMSSRDETTVGLAAEFIKEILA